MSTSVFEYVAIGIMKKKYSAATLASQTTARFFRALFGTTPDMCARLWKMLSPETNADFGNGVHPKHLLWGLMLLKVYGTEPVLASLAGGCDVQTFRKWAWQFVHAIASLSDTVVRTGQSASTCNG
jgi:hypothetical protein